MNLSLVLFVHITGVLGLFAGLALEAFGVEAAGKGARRIAPTGMALALVSGFYLARRLGVFGDGWLRVSLGAIVMMAVAGALARRSDALRRFSLRVRTALALAVVFLMTTTPGAVMSLAVVGVALVGSTLAGLPRKQQPATGEQVREVSEHGRRLASDAPSS